MVSTPDPAGSGTLKIFSNAEAGQINKNWIIE